MKTCKTFEKTEKIIYACENFKNCIILQFDSAHITKTVEFHKVLKSTQIERFEISKFWKLANFGNFELWKLLTAESHNMSFKKHSKFNHFCKLNQLKFLVYAL